MKKKIIGILLLVVVFDVVEAQTVWTMDRCMRYAIEHSTTVQRKVLEASNSRQDYGTALAAFLPKVTVGVNAQYNWGRNIDPETNTYNTVTTFNNYYELGSSMSLFRGGQIINQFRQAKLARRIGDNNIVKAQDDKAIEVMQKFVDAVYYRACIGLAQDKLDDSRQLLVKVSRQEELGMKGHPDVAQIKAQVAEDDYNLTHQQNQYNVALLALKSTMNYPTNDTLQVDTLTSCTLPAWRMDDTDDIYRYAAVHHPDARAAEMNIVSSRYQYHIQKGKLLPSLSLAAGVATNYYRNLSGGTALPFSTQFKNNRGEYVGVTLSIPIFDLSLHKEMRKARNNVQIALLDRDETLRRLHTDIDQAVMDRNGYVKEIAQMAHKVEADSIAYHAAHRKFEEGMMSAIDLHTSANSLLQARISLLQMRMLYVLKDRLVDYYKGANLIKDNK